MGRATEDTITDKMADYLEDHGFSIRTQVSVMDGGKRHQPDFEIDEGGTYFGEAKFESDKWPGFAEARDYGQISDANGAFLLAYPDSLKSEGAQSRLGEHGVETILSGHDYTAVFLRPDEPTDMVTLQLEEIPNWLRENLEHRRRPEPDPDEVISIFRKVALELNEKLETAPDENLFRNVLGASPDEENLQEAARKTAGFLLVNQLTFYRVLSATGRFPEIDEDTLATPSDLNEYFDTALEVDYTPVFSFRISEELPQEALPLLKRTIKTIYAIGPENISHDVLGKVFHELIPIEIRKPIAAYYTMNKSADILAGLAIDSADDTILDPACGSGSILTSAYLRKRELSSSFVEADHRRFVEEEIAGIDVMPFAAHMSCIHLALQAPIYETDEVNIGIEDSTKLRPGRTINPLSFVLPDAESQSGLTEWEEGKRPDRSDEQVEAGSVAMDAAEGKEMELEDVDVVFMNPPFSRQESVAGFAENYKNLLEDRFSRRNSKGQLHGKMNFSSYFMFLADFFLDEGGRIASVLPASILTNSSDAGVREMLRDEYTIEYIFSREDAPNFSEDTDRREILLIARKGYEEGANASFVTLNTLDVDPHKIAEVASGLSAGEEATQRDFWIRKASLDELDVHNMFAPFSVHNPELLNLWDEVNAASELVQIQNMDTGLIRGGSSHPWQDGVSQDPNSNKQKEDYWTTVEASSDSITTQHKHSGDKIEIPRENVHPYFLRYSYRYTIDVSELDEYVIIDTDFDGYDRFYSLGGGDDIPEGWKDHIESADAHASVQRKFDLTAPGSSHLSFYSDSRRTFHRMWCFANLNQTEAKIFSAWLDSNLGLLQMIISRLPERGGWTNYRKFSVSRFSVINPSTLGDDEKNELVDAFESYRDENIPSLAERVAHLTDPNDLSDREYTQAKSAFGDDVTEVLGDGMDAVVQLDEAVMKAIGFGDERQEEIKADLYPKLLMELIELKEMMD